jgi:DNA-binding NarL/FixJ family response regulator
MVSDFLFLIPELYEETPRILGVIPLVPSRKSHLQYKCMVSEIEEKNQIRVILVEDYALIRAGMRALLDNLPNITLVAEAHDGPEAIDLICEHHPDLVLLDIGLPTINGHEVTATISDRFPDVQVLILSSYTGQDDIVQALHGFSRGWLQKRAGLRRATSRLQRH